MNVHATSQYPRPPRRVTPMLRHELRRQYRIAHGDAREALAEERQDAGFHAYYALLALMAGVFTGWWLAFVLVALISVGLVRRGRRAQEAMAIIAWADRCLTNLDRPSFADCHAKHQRS